MAHGQARAVLEHLVKVMLAAVGHPALEPEQVVEAALALWVEMPLLMAAEMAVLVCLAQLLVPLCFTLAVVVEHPQQDLELALGVAVLAVVAEHLVVVIHPQALPIGAQVAVAVHLLGKMVLLAALELL